VQDVLLCQADMLRAWVAEGAAIYVCGSLEGMAAAVDSALKQVLSDNELVRMISLGRYRRDVY
jgi:sulfite reductase (NADPH) flavoprotein alpha-component